MWLSAINQSATPIKTSKSFGSRLTEGGFYSKDISMDLLSVFMMIELNWIVVSMLIGQ